MQNACAQAQWKNFTKTTCPVLLVLDAGSSAVCENRLGSRQPLGEVDKEANSTCQTVVLGQTPLLAGACSNHSDAHKARECLHSKTFFFFFCIVFFHPMSSCFLTLFLLHLNMWVLIFSYHSWVFPLLYPTVSASVSLLCLPPVLHPGPWLGSCKLLPSSPLPAACFLNFSSPEYHSHIPTSYCLFFSFPLQPTFPVSLPWNFLFLHCETCHNQVLRQSVSLPCNFELHHYFHSCLFLVKGAQGAERCINIHSSPEQPGTLSIKKVIFLLSPELLRIARFLFLDVGKSWVFHYSCS